MPNHKSFERQLEVFKSNKMGFLHTSEALGAGIHPRDLYAMKDQGLIEQVDRGLFRLAGGRAISNQDLVSVSFRVRKGIICLISALAFHDITTQIPHEVYVALPFGAERPRITFPPTRFCWLKEPAYSEGKTFELARGTAASIRIYSPAKTVADCFKFRNKIGLDVAIEALKLCLERKRAKPDELLKYARICRVERVMRPYLEALA